MITVVKHFLAGGEAKNSPSHQVLVHVDEAALHDQGGQSDLPVESVRRITCDTDIVEVTRDVLTRNFSPRITWSIGRMVVRPTWITRYACVTAIIDCCMRVVTQLRRTLRVTSTFVIVMDG